MERKNITVLRIKTVLRSLVVSPFAYLIYAILGIILALILLRSYYNMVYYLAENRYLPVVDDRRLAEEAAAMAFMIPIIITMAISILIGIGILLYCSVAWIYNSVIISTIKQVRGDLHELEQIIVIKDN